jgi:anti-sigma factor RsiW
MAFDGEPVNDVVAEEHELACREIVELITAYLEDALDDDERAEVARHLDVCDDCSRYLEQMRQTVRFLNGLDANGLTPETKQRLLATFRTWRTSSPE